jgi:hypothetical protein
MELAEQIPPPPCFTLPHVDTFLTVPAGAEAGAIERKLSEMRIDDLRDAIRKNQVTFPSQVPTFPKHDRPDLQRKLVQLYFVLGWSGPKIGVRYGLRRLRVQQILNAWKRRAVELGYIQTVPAAPVCTRPADHGPIEVVLSPVLSGTSFPVVQPSAPLPSPSHGPIDGSGNRSNNRPRSRFDISQIVSVLEQLQAGRTVAEMANEVGVSAYTIRVWKDQHEVSLLRHENAQLKERLAKLSTVEKALIDLIIRSDNVHSASFMPFSRMPPHTESDYRESL